MVNILIGSGRGSVMTFAGSGAQGARSRFGAGGSYEFALVNEAGNDVAIGTRHLHLRPGIEHQETFAVGMRFDLANQIQIHDSRAVDALESPGV